MTCVTTVVACDDRRCRTLPTVMSLCFVNQVPYIESGATWRTAVSSRIHIGFGATTQWNAKNARRRCALFWVSWTYANVCKICAKWLTIVIRVNWLLLLLHRYASDGRMLTAKITFIYTSYYTSHLSHNMQIWPRARRMISHWFFGRATCCGILRYRPIAAKTTQHATHAIHARSHHLGVNAISVNDALARWRSRNKSLSFLCLRNVFITSLQQFWDDEQSIDFDIEILPSSISAHDVAP